jgi:molecular chaperone IbpA
MTYIKDVFGRDVQLYDKFFVGFDEQLKRMQQIHNDVAKNIPNYPPYNIKKTSDTTYAIEIAVAGFAKSQIEIELDGDKLHVRGSAGEDQTQSELESYLYRGLATRPFTRTFMLNDNIEVKSAAFVNGMLKIILEHIIPEKNKPTRIKIEDDEPSTVSSYTSKNLPMMNQSIFGTK